jgi:hypothetical protein
VLSVMKKDDLTIDEADGEKLDLVSASVFS